MSILLTNINRFRSKTKTLPLTRLILHFTILPYQSLSTIPTEKKSAPLTTETSTFNLRVPSTWCCPFMSTVILVKSIPNILSICFSWTSRHSGFCFILHSMIAAGANTLCSIIFLFRTNHIPHSTAAIFMMVLCVSLHNFTNSKLCADSTWLMPYEMPWYSQQSEAN